ncbi:MAG: hypothetical protein INH34_01625 [Phycisphaerales bacterium]|nr:hypothetical protein [Phycisphaerales bacterium]
MNARGKLLLEHLVAAQAELARHDPLGIFGEMPLSATDFAIGWERGSQYHLMRVADEAIRSLIAALQTADEERDGSA